MTKHSATRFIFGATHEIIDSTDGRIVGLFDKYDSNRDGIL
jgi:hypothetical protein